MSKLHLDIKIKMSLSLLLNAFNIVTAFDGRTNISVVCTAKLTDLSVVSVT